MSDNTKEQKTYKSAGVVYGTGKWGNEFTGTPTVGAFKRLFDNYAEDTGDELMHSHNIPTSVRVVTLDEDDDTSYRIVALETEQLGGCGCTSGITILIAKDD